MSSCVWNAMLSQLSLVCEAFACQNVHARTEIVAVWGFTGLGIGELSYGVAWLMTFQPNVVYIAT